MGIGCFDSLCLSGFLSSGLCVFLDTQFPGSVEGAGENIFVRSGEADMSSTHASPAAVNGEEDFGEFLDEGGLLLGREHEVAIALLGGSESRKDAASDAEVGATHVGTFFGAFEAKGDAAEVGDVHVVTAPLRLDLGEC